MTDDDELADVNPDDPREQLRYFRRLRSAYKKHAALIEDQELKRLVREGLGLCNSLEIKSPQEVVRFIALRFLVTQEQRNSPLLDHVIRLVIENTDYSARRRLNFLYKHVLGRPVPNPEPNFGPWFVNDADSDRQFPV